MTAPLELVLMWHMHQPDYRDYATGEFRLPWVYLHAIKDYTDMAAHLEAHPGIRSVVNFTPVLLDQIEDYADQFATGNVRDPLLRMLARGEDTALTPEERAFVLLRCFEANAEKMSPSSVGVNPSSFRMIGPATAMFTRSMYAMKYIRHRTNRMRCLICSADRFAPATGAPLRSNVI